MMKTDDRVVAVVVTYNRKELLKECLSAVLGQTRPVSRLVVVDNASTDGTKAALEEAGFLAKDRVEYLPLAQNLGGAGGFYHGMKHVVETLPYDFIWIMDDDTIPTPTCLEELLRARARVQEKAPETKVSFLASTVRGMQQEPMNMPDIDFRPGASGYAQWDEFLAEGLVRISKATFVSILVSQGAVRSCGLPWHGFFIWGDDSEYTNRIVKGFGPAYYVAKSLAIHKRKASGGISIAAETNPSRLRMLWYHYRNQVILGVAAYGYLNAFRGALQRTWQNRRAFFSKNFALKFRAIVLGSCSGFWAYRSYRAFVKAQVRKSEPNP